jgi:hypothetical protein
VVTAIAPLRRFCTGANTVQVVAVIILRYCAELGLFL